jgi:hypothetical protein
VIIDFHTHIFPPDVRDHRDEYASADATFAEMYADSKAKIATAEDLLASMDAAGVDVSVALGFAWQEHEDIVRHNDYLLDVGARSAGRIIPFTTVNMADTRAAAEVERCARAGARGIGELRPENQFWHAETRAGDELATLADRHKLILLFHVTERGNRTYSGRLGYRLEHFIDFTTRHSDTLVVGAHLGGGIYAESPDAAVYVDTAAQPLLYRDHLAAPALAAVPPDALLFGSDFPLISQERQIDELRRLIDDPVRLDAALGGNAARLLGFAE